MSEPFATVAEFLRRFDELFVAQLTSATGAVADQNKVADALADATGELAGFLGRLPTSKHPPAETLRVHCIKVAIALLAQGRPGKEFDSIRNAYTDTIAFYRDMVTASEAANGTSSLGISSDAPDPVFTDSALSGFVPRV